jgi:transcriptional regulator with XRE-family HTH domain
MIITRAEYSLIIGSKIRELRVAKRFTIEQLSFSSGIDSKQIIRIELGRINTSIFQIYRIANALSVDMSEIFYINQ